MPTKQLIAGCILGALATVAVGLGYGYQQPAELPTAYHDFAEVPRDSDEFDRQWHNLGTAIWRETIKHPHATLFVACSLKLQPRADAGAVGGGGEVVQTVADPHSVQAEGREAAYLLWKKAADRPAEFSERSEAIGEFRDAIEHPGFRELVAQVKRERES